MKDELDALMSQSAHIADSVHVDRSGWTQEQWADDAVRLMGDIDGSVLSLVNGHVNALINVARADRLQSRILTAERDEARDAIERAKAGWAADHGRGTYAMLCVCVGCRMVRILNGEAPYGRE